MNKKLVLAIAIAVFTCLLIGGATFALFTAFDATTPASFTAGTLGIDADRDLGDPNPGPMFYVERNEASGFSPGSVAPGHQTGLWYPGKSVTSQLDIKNTGSLDFRLKGFSADLTGINDTLKKAKFGNTLNIKIWVSGTNTILYNGNLGNLEVEQAIPQNLRNQTFTSTEDGVLHLTFQASMPYGDAPDNDLQGVTPVVKFWVYAEQFKNQ